MLHVDIGCLLGYVLVNSSFVHLADKWAISVPTSDDDHSQPQLKISRQQMRYICSLGQRLKRTIAEIVLALSG